jgi:hypothetical protein
MSIVVPGGGPSRDGARWIACRPGFFLPVRVLSRLFRRLFLDELRAAFDAGQLGFFGDLADLVKPADFVGRLRNLRSVEWVVYAKPPFGGPEQVLAYLGRYTHRVAIANSRLVGLTGSDVSFRWKDYRHQGKAKLMVLAADEFIRRFLLHTLPDGFHRIRHYGFLANGHRAAKLALCRELLAAASIIEPATPTEPKEAASAFDRCPCCGGAMVTFAILLPATLAAPSPILAGHLMRRRPASLRSRQSGTGACRQGSSCLSAFPVPPSSVRRRSKAPFRSPPTSTARHYQPRPPRSTRHTARLDVVSDQASQRQSP